MSSFEVVRLVAWREIRQRLRSKLFVWTSLAIGAILSVAAAVPGFLGTFDGPGEDEVTAAAGEPVVIAVVGSLSPAAADAIGTVVGPYETVEVADEAAAERAVEGEEADVAVVPGERVIARAQTSMFQAAGDPSFPIADALGTVAVLETTGADEAAGEVLMATPLPVDRLGEQDPAESAARLIVANLGVVFLFAVLIMYSSMIINGVIEEKGSRVIELLIEAVPARQLMTGKVLGLGVVGIGQTLVIFGVPGLVLALSARAVLPAGVGALSWLIVLWFALGYAFYAVIAAGFGSLVSRPEEAQAVLVPANVLMVAGYFVGFVAIQAPDATFARIFALFPPSAPYVMLVRQTLGSPTLVEVLTSIVLMVAAIFGATLLAARLYRGGILRIGARVPFRDAWRGADV
jgi:ABC-2 type transport system permease protein